MWKDEPQATRGPSHTAQGAPLAGVRVLDLTRLLPGPMCTLHLADLGADVIKIEDLGLGDYAAAGVREQVNRNKRGLRIDLKHPDGVATLLRLCDRADVLVEGFRPGVMERLGVGWDAARARNPRLVYCSISGYGQTGPLRDAPGHDMNYAALCGVADQMGQAGGAPALSNVPVADLLGGTMPAVMGILAALFDVARGGAGRHVDIAIADGLMAHAVIPNVAVNSQGQARPVGQDKLTGALPCYNYYRTADGRWLAVGALEKKFWDRFCDCLERPDLKPRHPGNTTLERDTLRQEIAALLATRTQAQWVLVFDGAECCVTPVLRLDEALDHPHLRARGMVVDVPAADGRRQRQLATPVRMTGFQFAVERPAPAPGEHTDAVLTELGWSADELQQLRAHAAIA
jgi:alpha-methylacyl-CoA racemase